MPKLLSVLIFIARSDKTFAPWRRIFQAEAQSPESGASPVPQEEKM